MSYTGARLQPFFTRKHVVPLLREMADHGGDRMVALVKQNTPVGHQPYTEDYVPGALRESIQKKLTVMRFERGHIVMESGAETFISYAKFVEEGTGLWGPHRAKYEIKPKNPDGWLSWVDQRTGQRIFARKVMHPGSPGNHMFAIGVHLTEYEFNLWGQRMVQAWVRKQEREFAHQRPVHYGRGLA
jgi:hypothetical protein